MPPKPRVNRKISGATANAKDVSTVQVKAEKGNKAMPPPPDPIAPAGILEPEMNALSGCLKNAVVKTGQVYSFYADTRKLGIQKYAPSPPRSLTASLGRELEKYDQLCDSIESHLLRAISVLQRDIQREERRAKEAEHAAVANRTRSKSVSVSPTSSRIPLPPQSSPDANALESTHPSELSGPTPTSSPPTRGSSSLPGRRPSAISISSLHRPAFPLKLDLSGTSLRLTAEEASYLSGGLHSPITLAPKSARHEYPPELMAALASASSATDPSNSIVDIDLTLPDTSNADGNVDMTLDPQLGSTADKPITLDDLEMEGMDMDIAMNDLFGDSQEDDPDVVGLFTPVDPGSVKKEEANFLSALGVQGDDQNNLFASLENDAGASIEQQADSLGLGAPSGSMLSSAPSPGSLLAGAFPTQFHAGDPSTSDSAVPMPDAQFDFATLDLDMFTNNQDSEMNLDELLNIGGEGDETTISADATTHA